MRKLLLIATSALTLGFAPAAMAAGPSGHIEDVAFPWEGPFGAYDQDQLQRGLQVFTEVCAACHGLQYVTYRALSEEGGVGLPEDQVRAYAANYTVTDKETGEDRPAIAADHFGKSALENAPDLSLMAKARAGFSGPEGTGINQLIKGMGGPEYIYSILTGYTGEEKTEAGTTYYGNTAFPGGWIAMAPPMEDGRVEFEPAHDNSLSDLSKDVTAFLTWAAEPKMMARKHAGFTAVFFLVVLTSLLYLTNKKIWAPYKGKKMAQAPRH